MAQGYKNLALSSEFFRPDFIFMEFLKMMHLNNKDH